MANGINNITDADSSLVIGVKGYVLVYFWANWCAPCKSFAPILEEIASDLSNRITVYKLDVEESPNFAAQYNVRSLPTSLIFKDGKIISTRIGVPSKSKDDYVKFITDASK